MVYLVVVEIETLGVGVEAVVGATVGGIALPMLNTKISVVRHWNRMTPERASKNQYLSAPCNGR